MQDAKEEVRARIAIEDVIGEYVQLKRAGRNFKGLSPFADERTPSFVVSPDKQIWHDFSSGRGGDVFSFVMEVEGLDFREALEQLARKAGVDLSQFNSKKSGDIAKKKKRLLEANELASRYFQQSLLRNPHALEYVFTKRRLHKNVVAEFRIGYAPDENDALVRALVKRGFTKKELSEAGLTNRFGGDIFRRRMMVPLMDASGAVVGFTGRILHDEPNAPKYLNTPQTILYDKSRHVFGLSQAKVAIRSHDYAVIVEGNLDVVSSHQVDVKHVVATAGTAMTEWHLKTLSRLTQHIKLAFDGDKAGLAATERAIPIAQKVGVELEIVSLPDTSKDPDELIQQGVALWQKAIDSTQSAVDWVIDQYALRQDMNTAAGKRHFTTESLAILRLVTDAVEQEHYLKRIATLTDTSLEAIRKKLVDSGSSTSKPRKSVVVQADNEATNFNSTQDALLALFVAFPATRVLLSQESVELFDGEMRRSLARFLLSFDKTFEEVPKELQSEETYVKIVELKAETRYERWTESDIQMEAAKLLRQMEIEHKKQQQHQLLEQLRDAESTGDDAMAVELRSKIHQLIKETGRA